MTDNKWLSTGQLKVHSDTYFNAKFALNGTGVTELANYIISPGIIASIFQNPSDWLSSLSLYPFNVVYDGTFSSRHLQVASFETDIPCTDVASPFGWFNLGEYFVERKYNNFADFNGYTRIQVWLPYYGFVEVSPNDVIGKYMEFALSVDYNNGQGVYYISVSDTPIAPLEKPQFAGNIYENCRVISVNTFQLGYTIPLGSTNTAEVYRNIIMGSVRAMGAAIGAYAMSSAGAGISRSHTHRTVNTKGSYTRTSSKTGRQLKTPGSWSKTETEDAMRVVDNSSYIKGRAISEIFESSSQALSSLHYGANSDVVNNPNLLSNGCESVRVIIYRPKLQEETQEFRHLFGKPLGRTVALKDIGGYTQIGGVHIEGVGFEKMSNDERDLLESMLSDGIILPPAPKPTFTFTIDTTTFTAEEGMTWGDWADSEYNTVEARWADFEQGVGMQIKVDGVYKYIFYNEEFVQDTESIVVDGAYTTTDPRLFTFTIDSTVLTAREGMTWGDWEDSVYNTVEARFADFEQGTGMQIKVDDGYKYIYYNEQFVQDTDSIVVDGAYTTTKPVRSNFTLSNGEYLVTSDNKYFNIKEE